MKMFDIGIFLNANWEWWKQRRRRDFQKIEKY
jgi:hypothetical protein